MFLGKDTCRPAATCAMAEDVVVTAFGVENDIQIAAAMSVMIFFMR
jgi:hypothetical protein